MLSDAAQACAGERRGDPLGLRAAVPAPALLLPSFVRKPWIWLAVLAVSTVISGVALAVSRAPVPRAVPRLLSRNELASRPIGAYVAVPCDHVQNSDHGTLRRVTLCVVGQHILAVAGGNRFHDDGYLLQGYLEEIPGEPGPSWASALRSQIGADRHYYDFYLRRVSYEDDAPEDAAEGPRSPDVVVFRPLSTRRGEARAGVDKTGAALIRALAVATSLATLAGWFVWIRLWQLRRRVATWIVTG